MAPRVEEENVCATRAAASDVDGDAAGADLGVAVTAPC